MANIDTLGKFGNILKNFIKIVYRKLNRLALLNLLIIFGFLLYSAIPFIGEEFTILAYTVGDIYGQLVLNKHVIHTVDNTPVIIYLVFILVGFLICMYFVKKDGEGELWK
jgi:hypothetical protein